MGRPAAEAGNRQDPWRVILRFSDRAVISTDFPTQCRRPDPARSRPYVGSGQGKCLRSAARCRRGKSFMGAIFGIVGEGSLAAVRAMGTEVSHRGQFQRVWSPAPKVYFGRAEHRPFASDGSPITADWHAASDEGALPERFAQEGAAALAGLRGTFAVAICGGPPPFWLAGVPVRSKSPHLA